MKKSILIVGGTFLIGISSAIVLHSFIEIDNQNKLPEKINVVSETNTNEHIEESNLSNSISDNSSKIIEKNSIEENANSSSVVENKTSKKANKATENKKKNSTKISENPNNSLANDSSVNEKVTEKNESQEKDLSLQEIEEKSADEENSTSQSSFSESKEKKDEVIKFYESITGGKKEFASESGALERGKEIVDKERLDVISQNKQNGENTIKPDIKYYRIYPSVIDKDGNTWYYLHFFCKSSNNCDDKLKEKF